MKLRPYEIWYIDLYDFYTIFAKSLPFEFFVLHLLWFLSFGRVLCITIAIPFLYVSISLSAVVFVATNGHYHLNQIQAFASNRKKMCPAFLLFQMVRWCSQLNHWTPIWSIQFTWMGIVWMRLNAWKSAQPTITTATIGCWSHF